MSELAYLLSVLLSLAALAAAAVALWAAIEGAYFIYCRITGRNY